jgi:hypothetical protein
LTISKEARKKSTIARERLIVDIIYAHQPDRVYALKYWLFAFDEVTNKKHSIFLTN